MPCTPTTTPSTFFIQLQLRRIISFFSLLRVQREVVRRRALAGAQRVLQHTFHAIAVRSIDKLLHEVLADSLASAEPRDLLGVSVPQLDAQQAVHADHRRVGHGGEARKLVLLPLRVGHVTPNALHADDLSRLRVHLKIRENEFVVAVDVVVGRDHFHLLCGWS